MGRFYGLLQFPLLTGLACAVLVALPGPSARADLFPFDPGGTGNPNALGQNIGGFDFSVGNLLLKDGISAQATPGTVFQAYYQATVAGLIGSSGTDLNDPNLNRTYEFTAVGSLTLRSLAGGVFQVAAAQSSESFFRLYYDNQSMAGTTLANNLTGTGFADGKAILEATPFLANSGSLANYTVLPSAPAPLDQFGPNDWGNVQTLSRVGSLVFSSLVDSSSVDANFFPEPKLIRSIELNTTNTTPFNTTDPSHLFTSRSGSTFAPNIGTINGMAGMGGTDILIQADGNLSVSAVPEPSSVVLIGLGLGGLLLVWRRRTARRMDRRGMPNPQALDPGEIGPTSSQIRG